MSCNGCSTGRGDYAIPEGCGSKGTCGTGSCNKLNVFDWLADFSLPSGAPTFDIIEVRFKHDRKEFFRNVDRLPLQVGDLIAVEASPGHDIGTVSLTGELVRLQMKKKGVSYDSDKIKKVYRKARANDIEKWESASALEKETMYKARVHADRLGLDMKIGDVEYQGDKTKATFYYIADGRVDFRELIKVYAEDFRIRVEMRQIGARQEAAKIGGIGACGRELCCSSWLTNFKSVTTNAARYQQLSLNPQKLAGQCGKLKCCLNFELDSYLDAIKDFPDASVHLKTKAGIARNFKTDIFKGIMWYFIEQDKITKAVALPVDNVKKIQEMNKKGEMPESLMNYSVVEEVEVEPEYENVVGQDDLTRFDSQKKNKKRNKKKPRSQQGKNPNQQGKKPNPQAKKEGPAPADGEKKPANKKRRFNKRKPNNKGGKPQGNQDKPSE